MSRSFRWPLGGLGRASIVVGLAIAGLVLVGVAVAGPSTPDSTLAHPPSGSDTPTTSLSSPEPTSERPTARADHTDLRDQITGLVLPESDPVAVSIPRIRAQSGLDELGLDDDDGSMEVPDDPARAGWYSRGAAPGALGPAVIAGHVRWKGVPGVFHRLAAVRRGDQVIVTRKDGRVAVFSVTRVARFSKSEFPSRAVYGAIDHAGLRLITCGGTYDAASNKYLDNVVVFARLAAAHGPRGG